MKLPVVNIEILGPLCKDVLEPGWLIEMSETLDRENPVLGQYLALISRENERAALCGLMVYRLLSLQLEINDANCNLS